MNNAEIFIIFNPTSGSCNVKKIQTYMAALKARGIDAEIHETQYSGHATEIAKGISHQTPNACIVAAGGDGTIAEVVDGIVADAVDLAIYPIGTANVFALELGIPFDERRNIDTLLHGHIKHVYPGEIIKQGRSEKFVQMAGIGLDSNIVLKVSKHFKYYCGKMAYVFQTLSSLLFYDYRTIKLDIDGQIHEAVSVVISKGRLYAGRYALCAQSMQEEKKFSVVLIKKKTILAFLFIALKSMGLAGEKSRYFDDIPAQNIKIIAPHNMPIQCDGDIKAYTPVSIRASATSIKVKVP
ncbi:diacylglycerol/lipid kinase family protein [Acetobacter peroxydans]|jgi:YegS/Rv2252/BmrU family lipid kinase|uniref:diacylglycerol/lipid kinase family protein n=1 Tax=Acetobacter peroxydans TaxID=104098 RepID=UPI00235599D4|nr:YegS/Rv2252/BmrU family lipid kinase [Acetobacter peroxydans]MCH4143506.1 YegS/Rv2252/BmrU family lipid kinase [Acetobacter peroxydans]MCI1394637.1 YegS/Rv2252/BmrU family lipid kinase [Acetobacter peroxydans]MCI1411969.1 YegS/Rv2252/BmrU family lipid kinase [Acetobacter peroxydans]MCI1439880.1 YegS/Rv2252/BmrU family lipid kinase [Acetobacter peroxydans]MCI1567382.1 YegS/Rv2252/BmrU family lipid kinase [Acetobacter peroxydans]